MQFKNLAVDKTESNDEIAYKEILELKRNY